VGIDFDNGAAGKGGEPHVVYLEGAKCRSDRRSEDTADESSPSGPEGQRIQPMKVVHQARAMDHVMVPPVVAHQRQQDILKVPRDHKLILVDGS
jgi:hypothetical protein